MVSPVAPCVLSGVGVEVGLPQVRVHDLKHTFGRHLRAAGVSFEDRQDLLGHRSVCNLGDISNTRTLNQVLIWDLPSSIHAACLVGSANRNSLVIALFTLVVGGVRLTYPLCLEGLGNQPEGYLHRNEKHVKGENQSVRERVLIQYRQDVLPDSFG